MSQTFPAGTQIEKTHLGYSILLIDVEKELAKQEAARQDAVLLDQLQALDKAQREARKTQKPKRKPAPPAKTGTLDPKPLGPPATSAQDAMSLWPGAVASSPHKDEEKRSKEAWAAGQRLLKQAGDLLQTDKEHRDPEALQSLHELVTVYRGSVQKMIREFSHDASIQRLHRLLNLFDEKMSTAFGRLDLPYPATP